MNWESIISTRNTKPPSQKIVIGLALVMLGSNLAFGDCTVGVVDKIASADGRPIAFKIRDTKPAYQRILYKTGGKYNYIGIGKAGSNNTPAAMALNDQGLALGNSLLKDIGNHKNGNTKCQAWLWANCATVEECLTAFSKTVKGTSNSFQGFPTLTLPIIGAYGRAYHVECGKTQFYKYDPLDYDSESVRKCAVVVRANDSHKNKDGSDDAETARTGGNRYREGRDHLQNAVIRNGIFDKDSKGGRGVTIGELIKLSRIGEPYKGKDWAANRRICSQVTVGTMLAHGINKGEDPRIAVMWSALGNPDYSPYIPVWEEVAAHGDLTSPLVEGEKPTGLSFQARRLYDSKDLNDYDQYVNKRIEPMEENFIKAVTEARVRWASHGFVYEEAKRICQESSRTAYRTLKAIADEAQDSNRDLNRTPVLTQILIEYGSKNVKLSHNANDPDGSITKVYWEFGDGETSSESTPSHTYAKDGSYLLMCRVEDNAGSRNSIWKYVTIHP